MKKCIYYTVMPQLKLEFWDRTFSHFSPEKNDAQNAQRKRNDQNFL